MAADYDALAWFYQRYWRTCYHEPARAALTRLLYNDLPSGSRVLDLCCGTGHLTSELVARGYRVTGLDRSLEMLRFARQSVPEAQLVCADARQYSLRGFDAAVSTFDSVNHLLSPEALMAAFRCTAEALRPGGLFVFDTNMEDAYEYEWGKTSAIVDADAALFIRGGYDHHSRLGKTIITTFRLDGGWSRADVELVQRCHMSDEVNGALAAAGFRAITCVSAADAGMTGQIAAGRSFYRAETARQST